MALSPEQRTQALAMHFDQGMPVKQVAEALGITDKNGKISHAPVLGVVQQEKVRRGLIQSPGKAPRKVKETKTVTYDERPPEQDFASPYSSAPDLSAPLFAGTPGVIDRIEVHRYHAVPASAGKGYLGDVPPDSTQSDLQAMFSGGYYWIKAFDMNNRQIGAPRRIHIAGPSKPVESMEQLGMAQAFTPADPYGNPMDMWRYQQMQQQRSVEEQIALERERARIDREERERKERVEREDRERWNQHQMQMTREAHAQQLQIVMAAVNNKGGGMQETLTLLTTAKDLFDTGGSAEDPITEAIKNGPKMLSGIKDLMVARGLSGAPPAQQVPGQPPQAQMNAQQASQVIYQELLSNGLSHDEAVAELMKVARYLEKRIEAKKATVAPAKANPQQAAPVQQAKPQNGNGVQQPAQGVPPQAPAPVATDTAKA